jgi:L-arabinose transport system ATP-binding protein
MFSREPHEPGDVVLSVEDVTTDDVTGVSLEVRAGEVVGLGGLVGAGRSELAHAIVGDVPLTSGSVCIGGRAIRLRSPGDALGAGVGFAPEERKAQALLLQRSVRDNVSLAVLRRLARLHVVRRRAERELARRYVRQLRIRTSSIEQEVRTLSGGNQQKVVLARWLARRPQLLILDEPTRGVDVGAKAGIHDLIRELAADGAAVLLISSELPELIAMSDRIVVMSAAQIAGTLEPHEFNEERILRLAVLGREDEAAADAAAAPVALAAGEEGEPL